MFSRLSNVGCSFLYRIVNPFLTFRCLDSVSRSTCGTHADRRLVWGVRWVMEGMQVGYIYYKLDSQQRLFYIFLKHFWKKSILFKNKLWRKKVKWNHAPIFQEYINCFLFYHPHNEQAGIVLNDNCRINLKCCRKNYYKISSPSSLRNIYIKSFPSQKLLYLRKV